MSDKLVIQNFKGLKVKEIISYIKLISKELNESFYVPNNFFGAASALAKYLNEYDYINNEGEEVNHDNIVKFINRIKSATHGLTSNPKGKVLRPQAKPALIEASTNNKSSIKKKYLEDATSQELVNITNLIDNDNYTYEELLKDFNNDDVTLRNELIDEINDELDLNSYNGPNDYNAIYQYVNNKNKIENKSNDLNFLPINKVNQAMNEQPQIDPLANLMVNQISVKNLLDIYNRYAPNPLTMQQVQQYSNSDQSTAKAYLVSQILMHASDGTLLSRSNFGRTVERPGMQDIAKVILDMQRDIKRVKNAISPQGAEALVQKHNVTARPSAHWKLNKKFPNQPASLQNLTDINNDGIPDVVITNAENKPIFVNGYTTTDSDYGVDLAYYNQFPTRASRKNNPKSAFKKQLFNVQYDNDNQDYHKRGDVISQSTNEEWLEGYDLKKYHTPIAKRMSAYDRFKKYVVKDQIDQLLNVNEVPKAQKIGLSSKAAALAWQEFVLNKIYEKYGAITPQAQARIKKKAAAEIDNMVTGLYCYTNETNDNWSEDQRVDLSNKIIRVLEFAIQNPSLSVSQLQALLHPQQPPQQQ